MKIAWVGLSGGGNTDRFLAAVVRGLEARGLPLAGVVQSNLERPDRPKCDMELRILPDGPTIRISEDRGAEARGCVLDAGALEQVVHETMARLDGARCLIVNKFGKREAEGKGLVPVIAEALSRGIPVLAGVNNLNREAFATFTGEAAQALPSEVDAAIAWCLEQGGHDLG